MNNLAIAYRDSRRYAVAESLFRGATKADSTIGNLYFGLHSAQVLQGHFAAARATLDTITRRFPDNPIRFTEAMQDAAAQQDWARASRIARAQIAAAGSDTLQMVDPVEALAGIAMTRGRLREAERLWRRQLALSEASGSLGRHLFGILQLGNLELRYRNDTTRALALVDSALRVRPLDSLLPGDRRYDELARFYIAAGQLGRVRPLLAAAAAADSVIGRAPSSDRRWTLATLAAAQGHGAQALDELRALAETHVCTICVLPDLGRAYEAAGRWPEAAETYSRYLTTPWLWRYEPDALELAWTTRRLAEIREQLGQRAEAVGAYNLLVQLWTAADPELGPGLGSIRARIAELADD